MLLVTLVLSFSLPSTWANEETYFIITAYYSPVKWQAKYLHWTFEREIYVNGKGTHGASGEAVFEWMLAAPKKYPFGTKIHFEGYWVAEVQDRGGAIVSAGSRGNQYDRIDIWMWYGDDGRERAVQWGVKTLKGKIVSSDTPNSLSFSGSEHVNYLNLRVNPESSTEEVKRLQELFNKAGLYNWEIDGVYSSISDVLITFQFEEKVITSYDDEAAWYFWPKTIEALSKYLGIPQNTLETESLWSFYGSDSTELSVAHNIILEYGDLQVWPESSSLEIRKLQQLLSDLKRYNGEVDGIYKNIENDLIQFQIELWVIEGEKDWWAGYFWNQTRSALWKYYETNIISPSSERVVTVQEAPENSSKTLEVAISSEYEISSWEKLKIKKAISVIKKRLLTEESKGWVSMQEQLGRLSRQIDSVILQIDDPELIAKLLLIQLEIKE